MLNNGEQLILDIAASIREYHKLQEEYASLFDLYCKMDKEHSWMPLKNKYPEEHKIVLLCTDDGDIYIGEYESYSDYAYLGIEPEFYDPFEHREINDVIAWMPLPDPYKEDNNA